MTDNAKNKIVTRRRIFGIAGIGLIATGGVLLYKDVEEKRNEDTAKAPKDLEGNTIELEVPVTEEDVENMDIQPVFDEEGDLRITIENVGLDSTLAMMNTVDNVINPPDATQVYVLRDFGTTIDEPGAGTIYAVAHSLRSGIGPGNYLFDVPNDEILVSKNDIITISDLEYVVENIELIDKDKISTNERVWENKPNQLIFITCLQREQGRSLQNLVVFARLIE